MLKLKFNQDQKSERQISKEEVYLDLILDANEQIVEHGENFFAQQQISKYLDKFSQNERAQINFFLEQQWKISNLERELKKFEQSFETEFVASIESSQN